MKTAELAALLFIALWLQYISKVASFMSPITVEYEAVQKIKKPYKIGSTRRKMFPKTLSIETEPRIQDHVKKRHTVSKAHWTSLQKAEVIPPVNNKFFPE